MASNELKKWRAKISREYQLREVLIESVIAPTSPSFIYTEEDADGNQYCFYHDGFYRIVNRDGYKTLRFPVNFELIKEYSTKKWYLVDDCTTKKGAIYTEEMDADTREEAKGMLEVAWSALTSFDKKQRDAYYAVYAEDNGGELGRNEAQIDFESVSDEVRL